MNNYQHQNITDITRFLPHRNPMLMVDIIDYIDDNLVETCFLIPEHSFFVNHHHLSETGLIENAAQTCSAIVGQRYFFDEHKNVIENIKVVGFISAVKKIDIYQLPKEGQHIRTKAVLESEFDGGNYTICTMKVDVFQDKIVFLSGKMSLFLQKIP